MGVLQFPTPIPMTSGNFPNLKFGVFSDSLDAITTAGYLNSSSIEAGLPLSNADVVLALYAYSNNNSTGSFGIFTVNVATNNGQITLTAWANAGGITLPTTANHIATYTNTTGGLGEDPAIAICVGTIQSGDPFFATNGKFSASGGAGGGTLDFLATTNNSGDFSTQVTNDPNVQQNQGIIIPDSGGNTAQFILSNSVSGQLVQLAINDATPLLPVVSLRAAVVNAIPVMISGDLNGLEGDVILTGASGGAIAAIVGGVTVEGVLSGTAVVSPISGALDLTGATINGAGVYAALYNIVGSGVTQTSMVNTHGIGMINISGAVLNSQVYLSGNATYMLETVGGTSYYKAAGTGSGSAGNATHCAAQQVVEVFINGAIAYIPIFTQNT